jgi:hypothetical protein
MCGARERLVLAMLQHEIEITGKKILHLYQLKNKKNKSSFIPDYCGYP